MSVGNMRTLRARPGPQTRPDLARALARHGIASDTSADGRLLRVRGANGQVVYVEERSWNGGDARSYIVHTNGSIGRDGRVENPRQVTVSTLAGALGQIARLVLTPNRVN
jgi:hypothetical protein